MKGADGVVRLIEGSTMMGREVASEVEVDQWQKVNSDSLSLALVGLTQHEGHGREVEGETSRLGVAEEVTGVVC